MTKKDESAFPIFLQEGLSHNCHVDSGLTKREYFASIAMQGLLSQTNEVYTVNNGWVVPETIAQESVKMADALIEQLNKQSL